VKVEERLRFRPGDAVLRRNMVTSREMHAMWNAGDVPARMIEIISPSGLENFFHELSELLAGGPSDTTQIAALAQNYGLEFGEPPWLPDIVSRYRLRHSSRSFQT
jgi:hypothetical protein